MARGGGIAKRGLAPAPLQQGLFQQEKRRRLQRVRVPLVPWGGPFPNVPRRNRESSWLPVCMARPCWLSRALGGTGAIGGYETPGLLCLESLYLMAVLRVVSLVNVRDSNNVLEERQKGWFSRQPLRCCSCGAGWKEGQV